MKYSPISSKDIPFIDQRPSEIELDETVIAGTYGIQSIAEMKDAVVNRLNYFLDIGELLDWSVEHDAIERKIKFSMKWRKV